MDWLIQEAAKDLVNAEEEVMGEEHGGERREGREEGGPALMEEDLSKEEDERVKAEEGVGEEAGGACIEEPLPAEGVVEKLGKALETVFRELSSADTGVGEDPGTILNGEEQGGERTEEEGRALTGEGERCLRLGLMAERSVSWPAVAMSALGLSARLKVSKEGLEDGWLPEGRMEMGGLVGDCKLSWSGSLCSYGLLLWTFLV